MAQHLASVRLNIRYNMHPEKVELVPVIELILLTFAPDYQLTKKGEVVKHQKLQESRFEVTPDAMDSLIGQLTVTRSRVTQYQQAGHILNQVLKDAQVKHDD